MPVSIWQLPKNLDSTRLLTVHKVKVLQFTIEVENDEYDYAIVDEVLDFINNTKGRKAVVVDFQHRGEYTRHGETTSTAPDI